MNSLKARAGTATTLVLAIFVGATALGLDQAFRDATRTAWAERLDAQLYLLMGAAELTPGESVTLPQNLPEPRMEAPDSGLYARILNGSGETLWRSPSSVGRPLPSPQPGQGLRTVPLSGSAHFSNSMTVDWQAPEGGSARLTFQVIEDRSAFATELARFRRTLWLYLAAAAVVLIVTQILALRWGLRPLRGLERELAAIERGERDAIHGRYPAELQRLTEGLNTLLHHERAQQSRYRDALSDLAHSLKTPLAVLRGSLAGTGDEATAAEQLQRMDRIIGYQLQRATTSGRTAFMAPVPLQPVLQRLVNSLSKVHADNERTVEMDVEPGAAFRGSEDDLMELLGNVLDNAFKWSRGRIRVLAAAGDPLTRITVEDDGPGIPDAEVPVILSRGGRLDEAVPGQGIGLAVVRDIIRAYGGEMELERSDLGGLRLSLKLPGIR